MRKTGKFYRFLCRINFLGLYSRQGILNKDWDDKLNSLMERETIVNISSFTVTFSGGTEVWIANHPYFSGHSWQYVKEHGKPKDVPLPFHKTLWKFEELVLKFIEDKGLKIERYY